LELGPRRVLSLAIVAILSVSVVSLLPTIPAASAHGACGTCEGISLAWSQILVTINLSPSGVDMGPGDYFNVTFSQVGSAQWVPAADGSTSFYADPGSVVTISGASMLSGPDGYWCMPSTPVTCGSISFTTPDCAPGASETTLTPCGTDPPTGCITPADYDCLTFSYPSYIYIPSCVSGGLWVPTCDSVNSLYNLYSDLETYVGTQLGTLQTNLETNFGSQLGTLASNLQSSIESYVGSQINGLSTSLAADYGSLSTEISGLASSLATLTTSVNTLSSTLSSDYGSLNSGIGGLASSLNGDYASLSSQISGLGTLGTTNDATVASVTVNSVSAFSPSSSNWTPITTASTAEVVSGFTVSVAKGVSITSGVLYVSISKSPTSASSTYAIPIGDLLFGVTPVGGDLHFPYSIPSGATVYVQVVSTTPTTDLVQLQFLP